MKDNEKNQAIAWKKIIPFCDSCAFLWLNCLGVFALRLVLMAMLVFCATAQAQEELTAGQWVRKGNEYLAARNFDSAIDAYGKAISLDPQNATAYNNRGFVYTHHKGKFDLAIADFNKAIQLSPQFAEAYNNRGFALYNTGRHDPAIADFDRAIQLNPRYTQAHNNRGFAYHNKGRLDLAIADYTKSIQFNPQNAIAYINRGSIYHDTGQYELALRDFNKALELEPQNIGALEGRRKTLERLSQKAAEEARTTKGGQPKGAGQALQQ